MKIECTIKSLTDYVSHITKLKPRPFEGNDASLIRERIVFRGLSRIDYELVPSLGRRPSGECMNSLTFVESDLISEAMQKFPGIYNNDDLPVTKLAKLQHFGIPTRMLDVTTNALVALYFACNKHLDVDGEIIVFSMVPVPAINSTANIIADTYRLTHNAITPLKTYYYRGVKQDYAVTLQYPGWEKIAKASLDHFRKMIDRPLLVGAAESSTRQKNQQGMYILFPDKLSRSIFGKGLDLSGGLVELSKKDKTVMRRYIVPAQQKAVILNQMKTLGISEEFLFADNVDTVFKAVAANQSSRYKRSE